MLAAARCSAGGIVVGTETIQAGAERGACGFGRVTGLMPDTYRNLRRVAVSTMLYDGGLSGGGAGAEACGECVEITRAGVTTLAMVTDWCDPAGGPPCAPGVTSAVAYEAVSMDHTLSGSDLASYRAVPCPGAATMRVALDASSFLPGFIRLRVYSHRIGLRHVELRGAGPGVSATNPWTSMARSLSNGWDLTGPDVRRGGTGVQLRLTSVHGQVIESPAIVALTAMNDDDLLVQFDDRRAIGATCDWQPLRTIYDDALGSAFVGTWAAATWRTTAVSATLDPTVTLGCRQGNCLRVSTTANFGGVSFQYSGAQPVATSPTLDFWILPGSSAATYAVSAAPGCTTVPYAATSASWSHVTIDLAAACPSGTRLQSLFIYRTNGAATDFMLDDVRLLP